MDWTLIAFLFVGLMMARLLLFRGPIAPSLAPPRGVLDMHCHTAGIGATGSGCWVSPEMKGSWKFPLYLKIFETSRSELESQGDEAVFEKIARRIRESEYVNGAVILAMDQPYDGSGQPDPGAGELYVPNRFVGETVKNYPELYFGASVHPGRADAIEELRWSKANGAVLLKWLPNIQQIDPSDERYIPFYQTLVELDLPLLTHVGAEDSFSRANDRLGDPRLLHLPLEYGVKVIAAHVASSGRSEGQDNCERLLEMMPEYPNLVADISTLTQMNRRKYLKTVLTDPRLKGRIMYGTDHPLTNTPMVSPLQYPLQLTLGQMWQLWTTRNPWDRDVKLKAALGFSPEVFTMSREYLLEGAD